MHIYPDSRSGFNGTLTISNLGYKLRVDNDLFSPFLFHPHKQLSEIPSVSWLLQTRWGFGLGGVERGPPHLALVWPFQQSSSTDGPAVTRSSLHMVYGNVDQNFLESFSFSLMSVTWLGDNERENRLKNISHANYNVKQYIVWICNGDDGEG